MTVVAIVLGVLVVGVGLLFLATYLNLLVWSMASKKSAGRLAAGATAGAILLAVGVSGPSGTVELTPAQEQVLAAEIERLKAEGIEAQVVVATPEQAQAIMAEAQAAGSNTRTALEGNPGTSSGAGDVLLVETSPDAVAPSTGLVQAAAPLSDAAAEDDYPEEAGY